jgi:mono/diheme cytochrome c family protein
MVASAAFIIGFVVLGLAVLFLAFGGGPRGARESLHTQSRGASRAMSYGIGLFALLIGIGVPALVLAANNRTESKRAPGGVKLTDRERHGRTLFAKNCNTCHTLAASRGAGKVGPNLDALISSINGATPKETQANRVTFIRSAIAQGRARGNGQMPAGLLDGQDAADVADFLATVAGR